MFDSFSETIPFPIYDEMKCSAPSGGKNFTLQFFLAYGADDILYRLSQCLRRIDSDSKIKLVVSHEEQSIEASLILPDGFLTSDNIDEPYSVPERSVGLKLRVFQVPSCDGDVEGKNDCDVLLVTTEMNSGSMNAFGKCFQFLSKEMLDDAILDEKIHCGELVDLADIGMLS